MQLQVIIQKKSESGITLRKLFHKPHWYHIQTKLIVKDQKPQLRCDEMRLNYKVIPGTSKQLEKATSFHPQLSCSFHKKDNSVLILNLETGLNVGILKKKPTNQPNQPQKA